MTSTLRCSITLPVLYCTQCMTGRNADAGAPERLFLHSVIYFTRSVNNACDLRSRAHSVVTATTVSVASSSIPKMGSWSGSVFCTAVRITRHTQASVPFRMTFSKEEAMCCLSLGRKLTRKAVVRDERSKGPGC
jgi:hypothetical protein